MRVFLAALIFIATAVSILTSAAYPAYQMQAKRQMEEELIFRGEEYARAIRSSTENSVYILRRLMRSFRQTAFDFCAGL
jgi:hypothetical protein